jgi:mutator protein MutT
MNVAKVLIINDQNQYLLLWRSDHPHFPNDPDLPGGMVEEGEKPVEGAVREVEEEAGIVVSKENLEQAYKGTDYSQHGTVYSLYTATMDIHQEPAISWEHVAYEWVSKDELLALAKSAKDTYMHMVHDVVLKLK